MGCGQQLHSPTRCATFLYQFPSHIYTSPLLPFLLLSLSLFSPSHHLSFLSLSPLSLLPQFRRSYVSGLYRCTQSEAAQLSALIARAEFSLSELRPGSLQLATYTTIYSGTSEQGTLGGLTILSLVESIVPIPLSEVPLYTILRARGIGSRVNNLACRAH